MSIILLVRDVDDLSSAVESASRLLVSQMGHWPPNHGGDLLGVWVRDDLDEGLPSWCSADQSMQSGFAEEPLTAGVERSPTLGEAALGIRWSLALSGLWCICWMDGTLLREAKSPADRRRKILDTLVRPASRSRQSRAEGEFFPVFGAAEDADWIESSMRRLRSDYPQVINESWLLFDSERGILCQRAVEV